MLLLFVVSCYIIVGRLTMGLLNQGGYMVKEHPTNKLERILGVDTIRELEALDLLALNKRIAEANEAIQSTRAELDALPNYQQVKEDKKLLETGYREVKKRQDAIIKLCLELRK